MPRPLKVQGNKQIRMMMRLPPTPGSACRPEAERTAKQQDKTGIKYVRCDNQA
jgi:hypothetical protein